MFNFSLFFAFVEMLLKCYCVPWFWSKVQLPIEGCGVSEENVNGGEDKCHSDFVPLPNNTWASGAGGGSQKIYIFLHFAKQVSLDIFATDICFCCLKTDIGPFVQDVTKKLCSIRCFSPFKRPCCFC